ncbi:hypothetical protein [Achromobacter spanius]|uniref:Uncharacterized protein n=1 Tax=Achromobacter spanius TaxID=217203 RepID=A0A2S0IDJ4_9BURK|nr:hypothetical protein [Achromobacter spanius]AVJ30101.1 hypothetical protein CLM73_25040 [Achromobacter spanius]
MTQAPLALLERLRVDGVIRADQHAAALMRLEAMPVAPFVTLGGALVWLATEDILSDLDLDEMFELAATEGAFASNATRRQALAELNALCQHEFDRHVAQLERGGLLKALLPGPLWAWLGGGAIAIAAVAWYFIAPDRTPQCGAADVERSLRARLYATSALNRAESAGPVWPAPPDVLKAAFVDVKEVGYLDADRSRGCTATMMTGNTAAPIAYLIRPNGEGDMVVSAADPRVVRVRFGQASNHGKPQDMGQPAGAVNLAAAFERAVAAGEARMRHPDRQAAIDRERLRRGLPPERETRGVRNVFPIGNCKDLGAGKWSCRLVMEYRDRQMSAAGRSDWQVLEGDFSFVQKGAAWEAGENFQRQYTDAIVRARVAELKTDEAAAQPEEIQRQQTDTRAGGSAPR